MKIKDLLRSMRGTSHIKHMRKRKIKSSSSTISTEPDTISDLAKYIYQNKIEFKIAEKNYLGSNLVCLHLTSDTPLPPFTPSQYLSLEFDINGVHTTRPYSITSSTYHINSKKPYVEILVKKMPNGFVSKYIYDKLEIGDKIIGSMPHGDVCYNPIRDSKNLVMVASGRAINSVISMARSIKDKMYDCNLTIIYTSRTFDDYLWYDELQEYNTHFLLTDEPYENIQIGLIDQTLLQKVSKPDTTYFIFGSNELNQVVKYELTKMGVPNRRIRCSIDVNDDYTVSKIERYYIKAIIGDEIVEVVAKNNETILKALETAGIKITTICRRGSCGACLFKLLEGKVHTKENDLRRLAEIEYHYYHACSSYPLSNITIKLNNNLKAPKKM